MPRFVSKDGLKIGQPVKWLDVNGEGVITNLLPDIDDCIEVAITKGREKGKTLKLMYRMLGDLPVKKGKELKEQDENNTPTVTPVAPVAPVTPVTPVAPVKTYCIECVKPTTNFYVGKTTQGVYCCKECITKFEHSIEVLRKTEEKVAHLKDDLVSRTNEPENITPNLVNVVKDIIDEQVEEEKNELDADIEEMEDRRKKWRISLMRHIRGRHRRDGRSEEEMADELDDEVAQLCVEHNDLQLKIAEMKLTLETVNTLKEEIAKLKEKLATLEKRDEAWKKVCNTQRNKIKLLEGK